MNPSAAIHPDWEIMGRRGNAFLSMKRFGMGIIALRYWFSLRSYGEERMSMYLDTIKRIRPLIVIWGKRERRESATCVLIEVLAWINSMIHQIFGTQISEERAVLL